MYEMGDNSKGTGDAGTSPGKYFLLREAECSDDSSEDGGSLEQMFDGDTESEGTDFLDNGPLDQGNSAELYHRQEAEESEQLLQVLKRKFMQSPKQSTPDRTRTQEAELALSPILQECSITPRKGGKVKKKIRFADKENHEAGCSAPDETMGPQVESGGPSIETRGEPEGESQPGTSAEVRVEDQPDRAAPVEEDSQATVAFSQAKKASQSFDSSLFATSLMRSQNARATVLAKARDAFAVPMSQLCRLYKSDKTMSTDWVVCVVGVGEEIANAAHTQLQQHCDTVYTRLSWAGNTPVCLQLLQTKNQKNRETLYKLYKTLMLVDKEQIICNPPRMSSTAAALFWYKGASSDATTLHGQMPTWVLNQTEIAHKQAGEQPFELSQMVQWAYDNDVTDDSQIALGYALIAEEDENAQAFLKSNMQAKYVSDCAKMVKHYKRAEMLSMNMKEWISFRSSKIDGDDPDGWRVIVRFLRYQNVEMYPFLMILKYLLKGIPKKNCMCIEGPANTGKSMFAMSLIKFLGGKVLSFANSRSHFWLQPLSEAKIALVDDCTQPFWTYCDMYLRNGLDGNQLCIDCKHRAPMQLKFPPLILTSNVIIAQDAKWSYLTSRIRTVSFPTVLTRVEGTDLPLKDTHWKSFFKKFRYHLDLMVEDGNEEVPAGTLRVSTRRDI